MDRRQDTMTEYFTAPAEEAPGPESKPTPPKKPRKWPWIVGIIAAFIVGGAGGVAVAPGVPESDLRAAQQQTEQLRDELQTAQATIDDYESREQQIQDRAAELDTRKSQLDQRAADLDARAEEIKAAEAEFEANTIPGTGTFLVGEDIKPGTYFTSGASGCYWARLSGTTGSDILDNGFAEGPTTLTILSSDDAFHTERCPDWQLR
jgi:hypothetical protein